jgi:hypothetical protein
VIRFLAGMVKQPMQPVADEEVPYKYKSNYDDPAA